MHFLGKRESWRWRPPTRAALGIGLTLLALQLLALGQRQNATEDRVKAAYLFNSAKLAEWPHALPEGPSLLVIGVSGGDEDFLDLLKGAVVGKIIGTHPVMVKPVSSEEDMKSCRIVFFRAPERKHTVAALDQLAKAGVLLVGEDASFLRQGGMINLVREHGSVRFEVNSDVLDRSEIHFSLKILALAKAHDESPNPKASNSQGEAPRRLENSVPPEYPAIAERMNLKGTAQVQALVRPDGTVKEVRGLGGHPLLVDALVRAVMHWKYEPSPRETLEVVKFSFGLQ